jgi:L-serine/L-threonine ammonia-lyase
MAILLGGMRRFWMLLVLFSRLSATAYYLFPQQSQRTALKMSTSTTKSVAAEERSQKLFSKTPLVKSDPLTRLCNNNDVYLKLDCLQPSGSFKDRGMAHLCWQLKTKHNTTKIISSSGGNAGLAAATVARQLQLDCTVVVPTTTKQLVVDKLTSLGAQVQVVGDNWNEADAYVQDLVKKDPQAAYIPPYENPLLWTGHSTVVDEIYDELEGDEPSTIILSVGGGGLLCGVLEGLDRNNRGNCNVIAAETDGASSFAQAYNSGELVTLPSIDSIATSLGALRVSETALKRSQQHQGSVTTAVCSDTEAVDACLQFARDHRILVEPACGAALAVLYSERLRRTIPKGEGPIVVEVCGGSGVNLDLLQQWKEQFSL